MGDIPTKLTEALADRYTIEREVGAGGMATVYLAEDIRHRRKVAIKVLRPELAQSLGSERFLREIEIAAALTHPHVLPLHDSGDADGYLYYVMPFIEGESLRERLSREGALPVPLATRIFREIVDAVGEAHSKGIVHRDVKPANVLLTGGHALVADFGVAKAVTEATDRHRLTTIGMAVGTPQYMAPEQASADPSTDHRADLFAAGTVAYEMLTGEPPFGADSTRGVFAALLSKTPDHPQTVRSGVPGPLGDIVMHCLEKDPGDRPQTAAELLGQLEALVTPTRGVTPWRSVASRKRRRQLVRVGLPAVAVVATAVIGISQWSRIRAQERWAQETAIPGVLDLVGQNRMAEAAALAFQAEAVVGTDPVLERNWPLMTTPFRITTDPPGAQVSYRPYAPAVGDWQPLGVTPYETGRFPVGAFRFRIEREGFEPVEKVRSGTPAGHLAEVYGNGDGYDYMIDPSYVIEITLHPSGSLPEGMVSVPGGIYGTVPLIGYGPVSPRPVPAYLIDRTEVTNAAYREFVAAGGYEDPTYWQEPFQRDGQVLSWTSAMEAFQDSTGSAGPSTWILGQPPPGRESYPVAGLSWFEADAYCRWREKSLPTLFHWARAALPSTDVWVAFNHLLAEASNFDGEGPEPVGSRDAQGISGAQDLAGNVREWVSTAGGSGHRYLMGGAWSDPVYFLHDAFPMTPWQRNATDGVRCARFPEGGAPEHLREAVEFPEQDFSGEAVEMTDGEFAARRRFVEYDTTLPLAASVDSTRETAWGAVEEWVSVDAAYGGERLPIRIHLPKDHQPPYEAVIFFGGGNVIRSTRIEDPQPPLDFLVRSGRVLVEPIYDGTFQRNDGRTLQRFAGPQITEMLARWVQDVGRTIDYLEQRPDIDARRVSYFGLSLGAGVAPHLLPFEPRFRAAILYSGGFGRTSSQSTIDVLIGLLRRIRTPVLQLGGRHDFSHPVDPHQQEFFRHLGTSVQNKRQVFFDSGHQPLPLNEVVRESVDFLDRYVGAVR